MRFVVAAALAVPVGAVAWFEAVYLFFGLTGKDPPRAFTFLAGLVAFGLASAWPLLRSRRPAQVVRRACQLGLVVAVLLPAVTFAVPMLWERSSGRPDLGEGGLALWGIPVIATGVAWVLAIGFVLGSLLAARRLRQRRDR
jgi:hypothetical protein